MEAPRIPSLFKFGRTNGPKRFEFQTRYYDEQKERMKERYDRLKLEVSEEELTRTQTRDRMRAAIDQKWKRGQYQKASALQRIRVLIIVLILGLGSYYLYLKYFN